ncbi:MAG: hypothetical protein LBR30_00450 [Clostridioides sp.]|jgi:hypothetical protein|nr:hypothetical protein [Clostridioides sp.]
MKEIDTALDLYYEIFDDSFPSIPLRWTYSDEEVIEIIKKCIAENKDVYDMGYLTLDDDIMY